MFSSVDCFRGNGAIVTAQFLTGFPISFENNSTEVALLVTATTESEQNGLDIDLLDFIFCAQFISSQKDNANVCSRISYEQSEFFSLLRGRKTFCQGKVSCVDEEFSKVAGVIVLRKMSITIIFDVQNRQIMHYLKHVKRGKNISTTHALSISAFSHKKICHPEQDTQTDRYDEIFHFDSAPFSFSPNLLGFRKNSTVKRDQSGALERNIDHNQLSELDGIKSEYVTIFLGDKCSNSEGNLIATEAVTQNMAVMNERNLLDTFNAQVEDYSVYPNMDSQMDDSESSASSGYVISEFYEESNIEADIATYFGV